MKVNAPLHFHFIHNERSNLGGEDIAIQKILNLSDCFTASIKPFDGRLIRALFMFLFSIDLLKIALKNKQKVLVIVNPFPSVSFLAILVLGLCRVPMRLYIHDFAASCPAGTHYKRNKFCIRFEAVGLSCISKACTSSYIRLGFAVMKNLFLKMFTSFKKNKVYFVSSHQAGLAKRAGLRNGQSLVVGNID